MVFTSPLFLYLFLPVFLVVYYPLNNRYKNYWILAGSWVFYAAWRVDFFLLLVAVSSLNWGAGRGLQGFETRPRIRRMILTGSLILNLSVLGYFKYANFGIEALNLLLNSSGLGSLRSGTIILPVGISFYIFQAMSYTIDVYRRDAPASRSFTKLAAYLALFPQLIAGPIIRYKDLSSQLDEPHLSTGRFSRGARRFIWGLGKKTLLADTIAPLVEASFALAFPSFLDALLGVSAYALQLYFDFSAYSDMAIGLGLMLGFRFRENFISPYKASSITEFWQRWHISLSTWLRDYLYIPLGGNRVSGPRTYLNLLLVMTLGGLWHGAAWNFVIWGMWHGLWLLLERWVKGTTTKSETGRVVVHRFRTLLIVLTGWVFFRAESLSGAGVFLKGLIGSYGWGISPSYAWQVQPLSLAALLVALVFVIAESSKGYPYRDTSRGGYLFESHRAGVRGSAGIHPPVQHSLLVRSVVVLLPAVVLLASLMKIAADSYSPFLYFQF
jgi:alginate O-acetyltransferase complex protein AlgI